MEKDKKKSLTGSLTLGLTTLVSSLLCGCDVCNPDDVYGCIFNETGDYIKITVEYHNGDGCYIYDQDGIQPGQESGHFDLYTFSKSIYKYWFYIENADSVVEIHPKDADGNRFFLFRNLGSKYDYAYKFSDGYLSEIADTMRRRGITPYKISHEYIVNSTKSDFTLRCVMHGALDSEFFIPAGDSVEVERRWIMESDDISGSSRYEFAFADSVVFVYPCDAIFSSVWPKRYFVSTTSRSGGGMRRYEISEELLEFIASYMNCLREARPEWF